MKRILYSICIGSLALALTAGGAQATKDKRPERAKPQQRSANVHSVRPANTGRSMAAHRNVSAAQNRQGAYAKPRTKSNVAGKHNTGLRAVRERNVARNERMRERNAQRKQEFRARSNATVNRDRNVAVTRTRNDVNRYRNTNEARARDNVAVNRERNLTVNRARNSDANRERNVAVNRTRNAELNRARSANEIRNRNNVAINRNRNVTVNRTQNTAFYRGGNVRVTNNWRGDAFRGQRYAAFRNYNRQWHDRSWWRSHYT